MHTFEETQNFYHELNKKVVLESKLDRYTLITNRLRKLNEKRNTSDLKQL